MVSKELTLWIMPIGNGRADPLQDCPRYVHAMLTLYRHTKQLQEVETMY